MDSSHLAAKDTSPFGYTFSASDFAASSEAFFTGAPPLLSETENQSLADFFNNTNPFHTEDYNLDTGFHSKDGLSDFNWPFDPPPTIHGVSTTVPDPSHSLHGFHDDHGFTGNSNRRRSNITSDDDLRAASTLFSNAQSSQTANLSPEATYANQNIMYDLNPLPDSTVPSPRPHSSNFFQSLTVPTSHTPLPEQLAVLLPNHAENGSIDTSIAAQFAQMAQHHPQMQQDESHRQRLKRPYAFGSDNAFNPTGYIVSSPQDTEDAVTRRLMHDLHILQPSTKDVAPSAESTQPSSPVAPRRFRRFPIELMPLAGDEADQSEDGTTDDEDEENGVQPAKKRRKSKHAHQSRPRDGSVDDKTSTAQRKSQSLSRGIKARKASQDDNSGKKRKSSSASQKAQRENLTEEQKRSNHILSEQKRRNLIKHGFEELHDLVPELRNGGLSKSNVLMEAASFLEELIKGNRAAFASIPEAIIR